MLNFLNCVLVLKLSPVHCCTCATISIQGQLYRYSYRQISVTIHHRIEHSTTMYSSSDGYFQQDSTMSLVQNISDWFLEHDSEFTLLKWPPQSPDLNSIEYLCGEMEDSHYGCAADKSAATAGCYHVNMDQNLGGMFPTLC